MIRLQGMYPTTILLLASLQSTLSSTHIPDINITTISASTTLPTLNLPSYVLHIGPMDEVAELRRAGSGRSMGTGRGTGMGEGRGRGEGTGEGYRMERLTVCDNLSMVRDGDRDEERQGEAGRGSMSTCVCDLEGGGELEGKEMSVIGTAI